MKWIDHPNYFGPDRRRSRFAVRLLERRAENHYVCDPPPLNTALRLLKQHVIEAHGDRLDIFITRTESVALLARMNGEPGLSEALLRIAAVAAIGRGRDVRSDLIDMLNRAHTMMSSANEASVQNTAAR